MSEKLHVLVGQTERRVSRRELGRSLVTALAAGILPGALSPLHPIHQHLSNGSWLDSVDEALGAVDHKPAFLTPAQLAALDMLCETLIPGSHKAKSAEFIDLLLSVDATESQKNFSESLAAMEVAAKAGFQKGVASLHPDELHRLLEAAAAKESADHGHFANLKSWAIGAYYSSEIGMRELGWTPDRVFSSFPVCTHEGNHS